MRWSVGPDVCCWMLAVVRLDVQDVQHRKEEVKAVQSEGGLPKEAVLWLPVSGAACFLSNAA